jgi:hypothetical protein
MSSLASAPKNCDVRKYAKVRREFEAREVERKLRKDMDSKIPKEEFIRRQDPEIRARVAVPLRNLSPRNVVDQEVLPYMMDYLADSDQEEDVKRRLRVRKLPKRPFSAGSAQRRHKVTYGEGMYRWESEDRDADQLERNQGTEMSRESLDSETGSICSVAESVFSSLESGITRPTASSLNSLQGMAERLAGLFLEDDAFKKSCLSALNTIARVRFERNLRRLLFMFAGMLRAEARSKDEQNAARFVRHRATNSAHIICSRLDRSNVSEIRDDANEAEEAADESESDKSEEEMDNWFHLEAFIKSSKALMVLKAALLAFVKKNGTTITTGAAQIDSAEDSEESPKAPRWRELWLLDINKHVDNPGLCTQFLASGLSRKCSVYLEQLGLRRPKVKFGKVRIDWQCVSEFGSFMSAIGILVCTGTVKLQIGSRDWTLLRCENLEFERFISQLELDL